MKLLNFSEKKIKIKMNEVAYLGKCAPTAGPAVVDVGIVRVRLGRIPVAVPEHLLI